MDEKRQKVRRNFMLALGALAFFSLVAKPGLSFSKEYAFIPGLIDTFIVVGFIANTAISFLWAPNKREHIRAHKPDFILLGLFALQFVFLTLSWNYFGLGEFFRSMGIASLTKLYLIIAQLFLVMELVASVARANARLASLPFSPSFLFVLSFVLVIFTGALLLMLPKATTTPITFIDALFTSASAVCVTGLSVVDTGTRFTLYGQSVILALIQVGGLGVMTFATFSALILRGELGIKERVVFGDIFSVRFVSKVRGLLGTIIGFTVLFEALGVFFLLSAVEGYNDLPSGKIFFCIFHSVSAFCNAGFSLWSDGLMRFSSNIIGSFTIMTLIVLGGIGFVVLADFRALFSINFREHLLFVPRLSLHSKIVLASTFALIVLGACFFYACELGNTLAPLGNVYKVVASLFQSITPRTAGFNTVNMASLNMSSVLLLIILMFIGASPGSTGGGVKTTTVAVLLLMVFSKLRGRSQLQIFDKAVPMIVAQRAGMILFLCLSIVVAGLFALTISEPDKDFLSLAFEQVSAFATVGLSRGITAQLSSFGKIVIIVTMFLGRVGPMTFISALILRKLNPKVRYPEDEVLIG